MNYEEKASLGLIIFQSVVTRYGVRDFRGMNVQRSSLIVEWFKYHILSFLRHRQVYKTLTGPTVIENLTESYRPVSVYF